ncbi:MAG: AraC family transcriptional regulator [Ruminococcaceae bacterium]|nr:AraC family transcriptional regulator [Oscillospiraceae bacterium]
MIKSTEAISDEYIHLNSCGSQRFSGRDVSLLRPNGRVDYHILYIVEGECQVTALGKDYIAPAGSLIFFFPGERQSYTFRGNISSVSYYLHFSGTAPAVLLREIKESSDRVFHIGKSATLEELLHSTEEEYTLSLPHHDGVTGGYLLSILFLCLRKIRLAEEGTADASGKIAEACRRMHATLAEELPIAYYADACHLSESRFTHLFREVMGKSPVSYLIEARIRRAEELLSDSSLSVSAVADAVGVKNPYYFSRLFKKQTGYSPVAYRKKQRTGG